MEAIKSIIFASKVLKGLVSLESEIWKEGQFTLVLSLEEEYFFGEWSSRKGRWFEHMSPKLTCAPDVKYALV